MSPARVSPVRVSPVRVSPARVSPARVPAAAVLASLVCAGGLLTAAPASAAPAAVEVLPRAVLHADGTTTLVVAVRCPPGQVAGTVTGRAGRGIDRLALGSAAARVPCDDAAHRVRVRLHPVVGRLAPGSVELRAQVTVTSAAGDVRTLTHLRYGRLVRG